MNPPAPDPAVDHQLPPRAGSAEAADHIRRGVARGDYVPGQRLVEADVSQRTGASRAHVREALRRLSAEGLVEIEAFRGAMVRRVTPEEVAALGRVRESLEGLAVRLLAERGLDEPGRAALSAIRDQLIAAAHARAYADYAAANEALHEFIIAECGNGYLLSAVRPLRLLVQRTHTLAAFRDERFLRGNAEHLAIIDAILNGHGEIAEALMRMHVANGTRLIDETLAAPSR